MVKWYKIVYQTLHLGKPIVRNRVGSNLGRGEKPTFQKGAWYLKG